MSNIVQGNFGKRENNVAQGNLAPASSNVEIMPVRAIPSPLVVNTSEVVGTELGSLKNGIHLQDVLDVLIFYASFKGHQAGWDEGVRAQNILRRFGLPVD